MTTTDTTGETEILSAEDIGRSLKRLSHEILEANHGADNLVVLGIRTRGAFLARRVAALLEEFGGKPIPVGELDITLYRDDAHTSLKQVQASVIPCDLKDRTVILVDDVLYSGRTIRAALDALHGYGRAACVQLLVLLDRGHREFPIRADYVGKNLPTAKTERVNVRLNEVDGMESVTLVKP